MPVRSLWVRKVLEQLSGRKKAPLVKGRRKSGLGLEVLEARDVPATITLNAGVLTYTAGTGVDNNISVTVSGSDFVFADTAETIDTSESGATGSGSNSVTVPTAGVTGITLNLGDGSDTINATGVVVTATNANLVVNALNALTLAGNINSGTGTISILANQDGAGTQGLSQTAGVITTTNATNNALSITVNTAAGGTGNAAIDNTAVGVGVTDDTGPIGGRLTVNSNGGSILYGTATTALTTAQRGTANGGSSLTRTLIARSYSFTATGAGSIGTDNRPIQSKIQVENGTVTLSAGSGGAYWADWAEPLTLAGATATGAGNIRVVTASTAGHNLTIAGNVTTGSGSIYLAGDDNFVVNSGVTIGGSGFSGTVYMAGNRDAGNTGTLNMSGTIITSNTSATAVLLEDFHEAGNGTAAATLTVNNITVGNGGTITLSTVPASLATGQGIIAMSNASSVLNAGANGTVKLIATSVAGATTANLVGTSALPIKVTAGNVLVTAKVGTGTAPNQNTPVFVTNTIGGNFTATNTGNTGPITLTTTSGALTIAGATNTANNSAITLNGAGGVVVNAALGSATTGAITITGGLTNNSTVTSSAAVTVTGGLIGIGTITSAAATSVSGAVSPGTVGTTGTLTVSNPTLTGTALYTADLNGTAAGTGYDQLVATGTVTLNAAALLRIFVPATGLSLGNTFTLIDNQGSAAINGQFAGGTTVVATNNPSYVFTLNYAGGDGNDLVATLTSVAVNGTLDETGGVVTYAAGAGVNNGLSVSIDGSGNFVVSDTANPITLTAAAIAAGWSVNASGIATRPAAGVTGLVFNLGDGADQVAGINAGTANVTLNGSGAQALAGAVTTTGTVTINTTGAITATPAARITAPTINLTGSGIGTAAAPVQTTAATIVAAAGTGGVFLAESDGAGVTATATGAGDISITNATGTLTVAGATTTVNGNITLTSSDALTLNANVNAGTGTIALAANTDGTGAEGFTQANTSTVTTTNTTAGAYWLTVNTSAGGTGDARVGRTVVGSNAVGGGATIDANAGSILWAQTQPGTEDTGSNTLTFDSGSKTLTAGGSIGTAAAPFQTGNVGDTATGGTLTATAGAGGVYVIDWDAPSFDVGTVTATGGNIRLVSGNAGGHNLNINGNITLTGTGSIYLASNDNLVTGAGTVIGGVTFAGTVRLSSNRDLGTAGQPLTMDATSSIVTSNTSAAAVQLDANGDQGTPSTITLGTITVGDGGTITVNAIPNGLTAEAGRIVMAGASNVLNAGPTGTIKLTAGITAVSTDPAPDAIGTSALPIRVAGGAVIINSNFGNVFVTGTAATAVTSTTTASITGQTGVANTTLTTTAGALTVAGATSAANGGSINLNGAGGVVLAAAATTTGTGTVNVTGGLTGSGSTVTGTGTTSVAGTVSPGTTGTTGTLTLSNPAFDAAATYTADLNSTTAGTGYDQLVTTGTVNLNGAALAVSAAAGLQVGNSFVIVSNTGTDAVIGTFASGATLTVGNYVFAISYTGGDGNDVVLTVTSTGTASNQPPVNSVPSGPLTVAEDETLTVTGVSVSDPDAGTAPLIVTLTVTHGTLAVNATGITAEGTGTATLTLTGSAAALNAALATLRYTPAANYFGSDTLTVTTNDQGNTGSGGAKTDTDTVSITVTPVNDAPVLSGVNGLTATYEDDLANDGTLVSQMIATRVTDADGLALTGIALTSVNTTNGTLQYTIDGGVNWIDVGAVSNTSALLLAADANTRLRFLPNANFYSITPFVIGSHRAWDQSSGTAGTKVDTSANGGSTAFSTANLDFATTIIPVADTPSVTNATTSEDAQTTSGLVISRNPADGLDIDFFKITGITNGKLFKNDGVTQINDGDFITFAEGNAGLKFTPDANFVGTGSFKIQASGGDNTIGGDVITATITVTPVADTPSVTDAATTANTQTTSGLVVSRNAADGAEVTHFKVTGITNGTLFLNDGVTQISNGTFITFEQASAGLKFTPAAGFSGTGSFQVQASTSNTDTGLGGAVVTATITVTSTGAPITPSVTNATTDEDTATVSGLIVTANPGDAGTTTHYKVTGITNGTLFLNDGTPVLNGAFITKAQGAAGLKFTPSADFFGNGSFQLQASTTNSDTGLGGAVVTATITVNPVNDPPTFAQPANVTVDEDSGPFTQTGFANGFNPGPANEGAQAVLGYVVTNSNNALFTTQPAIAPDGTLTFTPAPNASGTVTVTVQVRDNGGGNDLSAARTFTITIKPVNDAPTLTLGTSPTVDEDAAPQTVTGFATFTPGGPDESAQTATYATTVTGTTGNLAFTTPPTIAPDGTLTYTLAPNTNGTATVQVTVTDSEGATSTTYTFTITARPVNDAPVVTVGNGPTVPQDGGAQSVPGFATFSPGGGSDETAQTPTYTVTNNNNALFSVQPTISANGTLTFTPAPGASGTATVSVTVVDNGGTANGGIAAGIVKTFVITVEAPVSQQAPPSPPPPPVPGGTATSAQFIAIGTDAGTLGTVRVLAAGTRTPIRDIVPFQGYQGGIRVALGDVNGDGTDDLIVGTASLSSHVKVFDVRTGAELRSFLAFPGFTGGVDIAAGDTDGDGKADIIVGAGPGAPGGHVKVFDGPTNALTRSFLPFPGFTGGVKVSAGDITGDGKADVAVLAGPGGNGHIKVIDGTTGDTATSFLGYTGYAGDIELAVADVDGNGTAEVVTAAQNPASGTHLKAFNKDAQAVRSFFAPTAPGSTFQRSDQYPVPIPGTTARVAAADFTGDNIADYLLGSQPSAGVSRVLLIDGATGTPMDNRFAFDPIFGLGVFVDM